MSVLRILTFVIGITGWGIAQSSPGLPYTELVKIRLTNRDCPKIDQWVEYLELQLKKHKLYGRDPVTYIEEERLYNARVKSLIWGLRVGCSNPDRYKQ